MESEDFTEEDFEDDATDFSEGDEEISEVEGDDSYGLYLLRRFAQLLGPFGGLTWVASKSGIGLKICGWTYTCRTAFILHQVVQNSFPHRFREYGLHPPIFSR